MIKITSMTRDYDRKGYRNELHFYIKDTELHTLADAWFSEMNISKLQVKSVAWGRICGYINRTIAKKIEAHFDAENAKENTTISVAVKARYSRKCGCSCGCSPGFLVTGCLSANAYRADAWGEVEVTKDEVAHLKKLIAYVTRKFLPTDRIRSEEEIARCEAKKKQDEIDRAERAAKWKAEQEQWEAERLARIKAAEDALIGAGI